MHIKVVCFLVIILSGIIFFSEETRAQDSSNLNNTPTDSIQNTIRKRTSVNRILSEVMRENILVCTQKESNDVIQEIHQEVKFRQNLFYIIFSLFLFFGILKVAFNNYTTNLLKVFFNNTLRQSQLTEQLLLAKLPSLLYNLFFLLVVSIYIFFLLVGKLNPVSFDWKFLAYIFISVCLVYSAKYIVLELSGWLTGYKQEIENYVFIVFLINKILAILLLPILLLISFSSLELGNLAVKVSYVLIFLLYFLRYFRSFSLLNRRLSISKFHFLIYVIGIEIIPILLIYKSLVIIIDKSL
jgi:hypothetical protein